MRFLHSADWQLGKSFGRFEPDLRAALGEARFDMIDTIGDLARDAGINHVLVAGDVFDTEWPEDRTIVQAVSRMQRHACRWWLLPGNHDYARNGGLWDRVRAKQSPNIAVLDAPEPVEIEKGAWLLPAPLVHRHNLDDPTSLFDTMATPAGALRSGLAHGSIHDFGSRGETPNYLAPDRARRSELDYLALGDWHGVLEIDARTWYAGTPETDRFHRDEPGHLLRVEVEPGGLPQVTRLRTGKFQWLKRDWRVDAATAFKAECAQLFGDINPATTLLQLRLAGIVSLADRVAILASLGHDLAHRLRYLENQADDLVARPTEADIEALSTEGISGAAATRLAALIETGGPEAIIAKGALERLFVEHSRSDG